MQRELFFSEVFAGYLASINLFRLPFRCYYGGGYLRIFLTGLAVSLLNQYFGWCGTWIGLAFICFFIGLLTWILIPETGNIRPASEAELCKIKELKQAFLPWLVAA
jgi:hypothetical protein